MAYNFRGYFFAAHCRLATCTRLLANGPQWDSNLRPESYESDILTIRPLTPMSHCHGVVMSHYSRVSVAGSWCECGPCVSVTVVSVWVCSVCECACGQCLSVSVVSVWVSGQCVSVVSVWMWMWSVCECDCGQCVNVNVVSVWVWVWSVCECGQFVCECGQCVNVVSVWVWSVCKCGQCVNVSVVSVCECGQCVIVFRCEGSSDPVFPCQVLPKWSHSAEGRNHSVMNSVSQFSHTSLQ